MFRIDEQYVRKHLSRLDVQITSRLVEVADAATRVAQLANLVLHVAPECSFKHVPIETMTFDVGWRPLNSELDNLVLLPNTPFFDSKRDYPIGRHDWFGLDTTADWQLVLNEISSLLVQRWRSIQSVNDFNVLGGHI